jgi:hypothetical protein
MNLQTSWILLGPQPIVAGIFVGNLLIAKGVRVACPSTGAIALALWTLDGVRQFAALPVAKPARRNHGAAMTAVVLSTPPYVSTVKSSEWTGRPKTSPTSAQMQ